MPDSYTPKLDFGIDVALWADIKEDLLNSEDASNQTLLLRALISRDESVRSEAREMISKTAPLLRIGMPGLISLLPKTLIPAVSVAFRPYAVGLTLDDFALAGNFSYSPNDLVFEKGDEGSSAFAVRNGSIGVYKDRDRIFTYACGEVFGDYSVLFETGRTARAVADEPSTLAVMDGVDYINALRLRPTKCVHGVIEVARHRMKEIGLPGDVPLRKEVLELLARSG